MIDPDDAKPASPAHSAPQSPSEPGSPINGGTPDLGSPIGVDVGSPQSPTSGIPWRRGHARQASLGTTKTSPSNRRRSLENTMHLIRGVVEGKDANRDAELERVAEVISSPKRSKPEHGIA